MLDEKIRLTIIHSAYEPPKFATPIDVGREISRLRTDPNAVELAAAWSTTSENVHNELAYALAEHASSFMQDNLGFDIVNAFENAFDEAMDKPGTYALATRKVAGVTIAISRMIETTGNYFPANDQDFDHVA
jgi:hypothetical protein